MHRDLVVLSCVLLLCRPSIAQSSREGLQIEVTRGGNAQHPIGHSKVNRPQIRVSVDGKPVQGAQVVFETPESGASGVFLAGESGSSNAHRVVVRTNKQGIAEARNFEPNKVEGSYNIRVTANYQTYTSSAEIQQTNFRSAEVEAKQKSAKVWVWVAAIGGAAFVTLIIIGHAFADS